MGGSGMVLGEGEDVGVPLDGGGQVGDADADVVEGLDVEGRRSGESVNSAADPGEPRVVLHCAPILLGGGSMGCGGAYCIRGVRFSFSCFECWCTVNVEV